MPGPTDLTNLALTPLNSAISGLTASVAKLQAVSNTATASLDALTASIQSHIARFVGLYSPAEVIKFERAVADLNATIGRALLPILQRFTVVVREIANGIAGLTPSGDRMVAVLAAVGVGLAAATAATGVFFATMSGAIIGLTVLAGALGTATAIATAGISLLVGAVAGLVAAFGSASVALGFVSSEFDQLKETLQRWVSIAQSAFEAISRRFEALMVALKPLRNALEDLATAQFEGFTTALIVMMDAIVLHVQLMQPVIQLAVAGIKMMTDTIRGLITAVRFVLGIETGSRPGESEGMAVRNVRFGSPEDAWREAVKNSFSLGATKKDPAVESANYLLNIWQILDRLEKVMMAAGIPVRAVERAIGVAGGVVGGTGGGLALLTAQRQLHD